MGVKRIMWLVGGIICCFIGLINLILPVIPTSPFLILGLFMIHKFSPKLHYFVMNFTICGHSIRSTIDKIKATMNRNK